MKDDIGVSNSFSVLLNIAGLGLSIKSSVPFRCFKDFSFYEKFIVNEFPEISCFLTHRIGVPNLYLNTATETFTTQNWLLQTTTDKKILIVGPQQKNKLVDNVAVFNSDYSQGILYQKHIYEIFRRFIDQFLFINILSRRKGFLFHASGVIYQNKGLCFAGVSGSGKSTLLSLWRREVPEDALLNDDRVALRRIKRRWLIFGTPWYGESKVATNKSARLNTIFFIRHADKTFLKPISVNQALAKLGVLALLPLWDKSSVKQVLSSFEMLVKEVPMYEFGFRPDKTAVETIKELLC
ncbi:MAG: hypothetical protein N2606_04740 [Candidatus Omnitrophica bacterium]|nr:hypothetical protein [Candidatus Omnitrophota bacterium]